jgi:hypothetical protein
MKILASLYLIVATATLANAGNPFEWKGEGWNIAGGTGNCFAWPDPEKTDSIDLSWAAHTDLGFGISVYVYFRDLQPEAVRKALRAGNTGIVPMVVGEKLYASAFSFKSYSMETENFASTRPFDPIPWAILDEWNAANVDALFIDLPEGLEDFTASLGSQVLRQLAMCRDMLTN